MDNDFKFQFIALLTHHPNTLSRGEGAPEGRVRNSGRNTNFQPGIDLLRLARIPHPTSLRSATFPPGEGMPLNYRLAKRALATTVSLRTSPQAGVAIRFLLQCKALRRLWRQGIRIPTPVCALARNDTCGVNQYTAKLSFSVQKNVPHPCPPRFEGDVSVADRGSSFPCCVTPSVKLPNIGNLPAPS